ncbi:IDEAL domain-containing protein [Bacillus sp. B15-48]|uniref:IDEAL domain-containing protein n=1 Tax=Bacillus sp. B15-48 TaxID=1548601 RepID=UPI00193F6C92|nr:IDEAL domain-containing protein [Bacillus sp. B15-48]MBM4763518.1 IDEAL domain-containing protein [Bacillus sp. B15-48]
MEEKLLYLPEPNVNMKDLQIAEMLLTEVQLNIQKEVIEQKVDQSLLDKNKEEFLKLTEKLKNVTHLLQANRENYIKLTENN